MIKYLEKKDNLEELCQKKCLIDFYADWCGPCKIQSKVLDRLEQELDIDIIKVNTDEFRKIALNYGIMTIPTLMIMENNQIIKKNVGYMNETEIKEFVK